MIIDEDFILVKTRWESTKVYLREIVYVERRLRVLFIFTLEEEYRCYEAMDEISHKFGENFYPLTQGLYANLDYVKRIKNRRVEFIGGKELHLSHRSYIGIKRRHNAYCLMKDKIK